MSVHYESVPSGTLYPEAFGVPAPLEALERHIWPRKPGLFIRLAPAIHTPAAEADFLADPAVPDLPAASTGVALKGVRQ